MSKAEIIEKTVTVPSKLPDKKAEEVADFADFILSKIEDNNLQAGIHRLGKLSK